MVVSVLLPGSAAMPSAVTDASAPKIELDLDPELRAGAAATSDISRLAVDATTQVDVSFFMYAAPSCLEVARRPLRYVADL
jgi:hypothetical protein